MGRRLLLAPIAEIGFAPVFDTPTVFGLAEVILVLRTLQPATLTFRFALLAAYRLGAVARDADELIGDPTDAALIIDESGFAKQGKMSVGASRQYLGRLGKVDNGQVAVFGVLAKGRFATAIDTRLYLPKEWTDDPQRCHRAGIPEIEQAFKTKNQLALEIVEQARRNGVRFYWVGGL